MPLTAHRLQQLISTQPLLPQRLLLVLTAMKQQAVGPSPPLRSIEGANRSLRRIDTCGWQRRACGSRMKLSVRVPLGEDIRDNRSRNNFTHAGQARYEESMAQRKQPPVEDPRPPKPPVEDPRPPKPPLGDPSDGSPPLGDPPGDKQGPDPDPKGPIGDPPALRR